jgi:lysozyme family protein
MRENLDNALKWVLAHEGGYVNHPKDPGGATNMGVTQRVYDGYRARRGLHKQSVRAITADEVAEIYKRQYWDAVKADDLPAGVDYAVFDYAVNSGPGRAVKDLQREVGATVDGVMGFRTLAAVQQQDPFDLIERLCNRRMRFLRGLRHWGTFGRGWTARVMGVKDGAQADDIGVIDRAMVLARGAQADDLPPPVSVGSGKGETVARANVFQTNTFRALGALAMTNGYQGWVAFRELDGMAQAAAIASVGAVVVIILWLFKDRVRKFVNGDT